MMKPRTKLEVTGLNLLLKQSHLAQIAQDHIQTDFEDGDSTSLGNLCWSFTPAKVKKCFLCSEGAFCVSVCACCFWAPLKRDLSSLHRLLSYLPKILIYLIRFTLLSLPFSRVNSSSCVFLSHIRDASDPLMILVALCWILSSIPCLFCTEVSQKWPPTRLCATDHHLQALAL